MNELYVFLHSYFQRHVGLRPLIAFFFVGSFAGHSIVFAQDLGGATTAVPLQIVLTWKADTTGLTIGYNIYRKLASDTTFPSNPINSTPIAPITNCSDFQSIIPPGSIDWVDISNALSDTTGGVPPVVPLSNVCSITSFPMGSRKWAIVQLLATTKLAVAQVMGQEYRDLSVVSGTQYTYQIRRVGSGNNELALTGSNQVTIRAGVPEAVPTPSNVHLVVGDAKIQVLWNKPAAKFSAFVVYRATSSIGPYQKVNDADASSDITLDIDSNTVSPTANGFTDYERWDTLGNPMPRLVPGNPFPFTGPANGRTYWYKVALKDLLGNMGSQSSAVSGMPLDKTPPAAPKDIFVNALESTSSFQVRWTRVRLDVDGHREAVQSYKIYRYADPEDPTAGTFVSPSVPQPAPTDTMMVMIKIDSTSGLRSPCRDSSLYFRVEAIDSSGNVSRRSIAAGAALKDTTRPANVQGTTADGFDDYIRVKWNLNTDCDIDRYLIYRSLCDRGKWYPCDTPNFGGQQKKKGDCGGQFVFIGAITHADAKSRGNPTYFDDHWVPPGSPLCYAYLVKAQDHSQNVSGTFPNPTTPPEITVCQRLRDKTPPSPAIISGMFARDSAIEVDYIGPPVQDIAAYHIFRSDSGGLGYQWIGGMTVVPPPGVGKVLTSPYVPPAVVGCDSIPLVSRRYMSAGTFIDRKVERKHIYWYKVLGVDQNGNQSSPDSALAMSTFTFATNRESPPHITSVAPTDTPCALTVNWTPAYDSTEAKGFIVFRGMSSGGPFYQLEGVQKGNSFTDNSVARNVTYWYRVVMLKSDGMLTNLSDPKNGLHP